MKKSFNDYLIKRDGKKEGKSFYLIYQAEKYIATVHGRNNLKAWLTADIMSRAKPVAIGKGN